MDSEQGDKYDPYTGSVNPEKAVKNQHSDKLPSIVARDGSSSSIQFVQGHDIFDDRMGGPVTLTIERTQANNETDNVDRQSQLATMPDLNRSITPSQRFPEDVNVSQISLLNDADRQEQQDLLEQHKQERLGQSQHVRESKLGDSKNNEKGKSSIIKKGTRRFGLPGLNTSKRTDGGQSFIQRNVISTNINKSAKNQRLAAISQMSRKGPSSYVQSMKKSYSGFDIGQNKACGSYFANLRQQQNDDYDTKQNFFQSEKMTGLDFIDKLIKQQEDRYHKRLPFERGHYHQCIPNPAKKNSLITVKLVTRVLDGLGNTSADRHDVFDEDQAQFKGDFSHSQTFMTYELCMPDQKDDLEDIGEGEGDEYDDEVDSINDELSGDSSRSPEKKLKNSEQNGEQKSTGGQLSMFGGFKQLISKSSEKLTKQLTMGSEHKRAQASLYKDLHEHVDVITGISPKEWAHIQKSPQHSNQIRARMNSIEFALVAFWDFDKNKDQMVCQRFFMVPNPLTRMIKGDKGTELKQVLYTSEHTKEVFFFFKGYELGGGEDLQYRQRQNEFVTQIAFLNLALVKNQTADHDHRRNIVNYCHKFSVIQQGSVLQRFLQDMNDTLYQDQKQLPNPTVIDTVRGSSDTGSGKTVVFTAYLKEQYYSKQWEKLHSPDWWSKNDQTELENKVTENWYPTIFFFDLDAKRTVWEIFGSEIFIQITDQKTVYTLTNEFWQRIKKSDYLMLKENDEKGFSVHESFYPSVSNPTRINDAINVMIYMVSPSSEMIENRDEIAPRGPSLTDFKFNYGLNKNLKITENAKVVEAFMHNGKDRLTLLYHGLGSYTFKLKPSLPLVEPSDWFVVKNGSEFHINMTFKPGRLGAKGSGIDSSDAKVDVELSLQPQDMTYWNLMLDMGDYISEMHIDSLKLDTQQKSMNAQWRHNRQEFTLKGSVQSKRPNGGVHNDQIDVLHLDEKSSNESTNRKNRRISIVQKKVNVRFSIHERQSGSQEGTGVTRIFEGNIDPLHTCIKGHWYYENRAEEEKHFEMKLQEPVDGTLTFKYAAQVTETLDVTVDFQRKRIISADNDKKKLKIEAIEAVDTAELVFFILQPDTQFVRGTGKDCYVQAKLVAIEEDEDQNGKGVVQSSVVLYKVSESVKKRSQKKKAVQEPRSRNHVWFYLNSNFVRTQERKDIQLWYVNPSTINKDGQFIGSVIFEEYGSDMIRLCFVTSQFKELQESKKPDDMDFPQEPLLQDWIVDYPLLAYKTSSPTNKEITIVHMALTMPQRIIHLGEWEFVSFVNHTQMVEQKLFGKTKETNCDIMFLVRREDQYRLMSFKSNPWLEFTEEPSKEDQDVHKSTIFLFSGKLKFVPTQMDEKDEPIENTPENARKYARRFSSDKIQNVQLLTHKLGNYEQYMLIIQFNDCIVRASLNERIFQVICKPENMIRLHLIRGYNEKVYYAETVGNAVKIQELEFHKSHPNEITKKEIFQLAGSKLVAFEADGESTQNDIDDDAPQSLYVMNDMQKIFYLVNEDDVRFVVKNVLDFSRHKKMKQITALRENDWSHVHITHRTISFGDYTYNLHSDASLQITVPKYQFGELKKQLPINEYSVFDIQDSEDSSDEHLLEEENEKSDAWDIQDVQSMPMTANMIALAQRNHREFCFVVKPAPGSRRVNIVGYQQLHEIEQMLFVSNTHVLLRLRGGKTVTLMANGSIVPQQRRVQQYLEENARVVGESQIYKGRKTVILEQKYGEGLRTKRYICLQFNTDGMAELVGIFVDPKTAMKEKMPMFAQVQQMRISELNNRAMKQSNKQSNNSNKVQLRSSFVVNTSVEMKQKDTKIKFAKEFFVTEKGEVVKMAGIITQDPEILSEYETQRPVQKPGETITAARQQFKDRRNKKNDNCRKTFISVFNIKNTHIEDNELQFEQEQLCDFKLVVFHCSDQYHLEELTKNTQLSVVGNYLCHRVRNERVVWVTKLKKEEQPYIPLSKLSTDVQDVIDGSYFKLLNTKGLYETYVSHALKIKEMVDEKDIKHIQMTEVPKAYFTTLKSRKGLQLNFYDNLLQITERNHGMIFDLDTMKEVQALENIDQLQDPDRCVNTGFIMSTSKNEVREEETFLRRTQLFTNEYVNLLFERVQDRFEKGPNDFKIDLKISGMLFRTFSEMDLFEIKQISQAIANRQKIPSIDMEAIVSTFEGHTIFSIFQEHIGVYEQIVKQLEDQDFPNVDDFNGISAENPYLRRLHRVLLTPTADWLETADVRAQVQRNSSQFESTWRKFIQKSAVYLGKGDGNKRYGNIGFKSIRQKSLHFQSARFRESLIEISMLCAENQINDFVENLEDVEILFQSMSPATVEFFQNAFYQTRFTKRVNNLKWRMGDRLQVLGNQTSVITESGTEAALQKTKKKNEDSADIQFRQVDVKMLSLDWVHASYKGFEVVGFKELILALANAPHESLFSTEFVVTLHSHFWKYYHKRIVWACFLPYIVYFLSTIWYVSNYAVQGIDEEELWAFTPELILRFIIIICVVYFAMFEFVSMFRDGCDYLTDVFNYFDWTAFLLNFYIISHIVREKQDIGIEEDPTEVTASVDNGNGEEEAQSFDTISDSRRDIRQLAGISMTLMWVKTFYWMRLFSNTSFYIRLIMETLKDIKYFLILFVFIMMCFGNALLVMNQGRSEIVYTRVFNISFLDAMLNQYILAIGDYDVEAFRTEGGDIIIWCLFIMATFITQITFLNLLIAIMGDTFDRVSEVKEQSALAEKIKILADYVVIVRKADVDSDSFLFAINPSQLGSDEQASWEGTVTQLKKAIDVTMKSSQVQMGKRMQFVNDGMEQLNNRMTTIDERINELSGAQQKLPIEIAKTMMRLPGEIEQSVKKIIQTELSKVTGQDLMSYRDRLDGRSVAETSQDLSARIVPYEGSTMSKKLNQGNNKTQADPVRFNQQQAQNQSLKMRKEKSQPLSESISRADSADEKSPAKANNASIKAEKFQKARLTTSDFLERIPEQQMMRNSLEDLESEPIINATRKTIEKANEELKVPTSSHMNRTDSDISRQRSQRSNEKGDTEIGYSPGHAQQFKSKHFGLNLQVEESKDEQKQQ